MPGNIILIGLSGSGKSSVARELAGRLGWPIVDTDQRIVERFGMSIADVFARCGEDAFRTAENEAVAEACKRSRIVISVGGGAPVNPANRSWMTDGNLVVRLDAPSSLLVSRMRSSPNAEERPLLAGADPVGRIEQLRAERVEAYAIANVVIDTSHRPKDEVADVIAQLIEAKAEGAGALHE